jgi:hypothetical protein
MFVVGGAADVDCDPARAGGTLGGGISTGLLFSVFGVLAVLTSWHELH